MNKVLQVELSGVLSEINGVHILQEVKVTTGEWRGNSYDGVFRNIAKLDKATAARKQSQRRGLLKQNLTQKKKQEKER